MALIARDTGFTEQTLYTRRRSWQQQGDLVPATGKSAEQWSAVAKFAVVFQTAGLNGIEPGAFKPGAGPVSATGCHWRQAAQEANNTTAPTVQDHKEPHSKNQELARENLRLERELLKKETALAEAAALPAASIGNGFP